MAGDFNGDGKTDVAFLAIVGTTGGGEVLNGDGTGRFQRVFNFPTSPYTMGEPVAVADFNGDGKTDILTIRYFGDTFQSQVWSWTGNTSSVLTAFSSTQSSIQSLLTYVITGDFNGDGKIDWAGVNPAFGTVGVYLEGTARERLPQRPVVRTLSAALLERWRRVTSTAMGSLISQSRPGLQSSFCLMGFRPMRAALPL